MPKLPRSSLPVNQLTTPPMGSREDCSFARSSAEVIIAPRASSLQEKSDSPLSAVTIEPMNSATLSPKVPRSSLPVNQLITPPMGSRDFWRVTKSSAIPMIVPMPSSLTTTSLDASAIAPIALKNATPSVWNLSIELPPRVKISEMVVPTVSAAISPRISMSFRTPSNPAGSINLPTLLMTASLVTIRPKVSTMSERLSMSPSPIPPRKPAINLPIPSPIFSRIAIPVSSQSCSLGNSLFKPANATIRAPTPTTTAAKAPRPPNTAGAPPPISVNTAVTPAIASRSIDSAVAVSTEGATSRAVRRPRMIANPPTISVITPIATSADLLTLVTPLTILRLRVKAPRRIPIDVAAAMAVTGSLMPFVRRNRISANAPTAATRIAMGPAAFFIPLEFFSIRANIPITIAIEAVAVISLEVSLIWHSAIIAAAITAIEIAIIMIAL